MIFMTMIARVADGLPLAASIQEDEQVKILNFPEFQNTYKNLVKTVGQKHCGLPESSQAFIQDFNSHQSHQVFY